MAINRAKFAVSVLVFIIVSFFTAKTAYAGTVVTGQRLAGLDRYETSVDISKSGWPGGSDVAVIATGEDFPDALCAGPLAKSLNAPVLLTEVNVLDSNVKAELKRLGVKEVYIVGGVGAVSYNVQNQITSMGIKCTRLAGEDRFGTSVAVASKLNSTKTVVVATGDDFPDALSIAPWAAAKGVPILLTDKTQIPKEVSEYIANNGISNSYVIGGVGVVSDSVLRKLPGAVRLAGEDRYGTNIDILKHLGNDFDLSKVYMATGEDFPDALSGSAIAAKYSAPIILVSPIGNSVSRSYADSNAGRFHEIYLLGGEAVVSDNMAGSILPELVTNINIVLPSASVGRNKQMKASVKLVKANGTSIDGQVSYSIENPSIASIDSQGNLTGLTEGNTYIVASYGLVSSRKIVSVRDKKLIVVDPGHGGWDPGASAVMLDGSKPYAYREAALNLKVAQKLKAALESAGYNVVMTRNDDTYVALYDRANVANNINADLFISIHHDSMTSSSSGTSAFYSSYKPGADSDGVYGVADGNAPVYRSDGVRIGYLTDGKTYKFVKEVNGSIYIIFNGVEGRVTINDIVLYDTTPSVASQESKELAESINKAISSLGLIQRGAKDQNLAVTRMTNGVSVLVEVGFISNPIEFQKVSQDSFQSRVAAAITNAIDSFFKGLN